jgi:hypothetical protein
MACFLPFRPWLSLGLKVFRSRTTGDSSTIPRRSSPALARHPSGLLYRSSLRTRGEADPASSAKLLASVHGPSASRSERTPFCVWLATKRSSGVTVPPESPVFRVWLPSGRRQPFHSREPFSVPHAPGLCSSGPCSDPTADPRFPLDLPLLRLCARPHGLTSALQRFVLVGPAVSPALPSFSDGSGVHALLSLRTSQVVIRRTFERVPSSLVPLSPFLSQPPKMPRAGAPGASFQRRGVSRLSTGAHLLGVPDRPSSATLLEREPVAAYFFSSGPPKPCGPGGGPLCDRSHPA